jgi:16S rRNA (guanine966-N2)-methyltransferase
MGKQLEPGKVRIIAGKWRGRRLSLANADIRPTPDRLRETLFNWLSPCVRDARVLDLFAGSGALGLEAASRGAASVVLVERDKSTAMHLQQLIAQLAAVSVSALAVDARKFIAQSAPEAYDIVFLDPPFADSDLADLCLRLETGGWLTADARIYLEMAADHPFPDLPANWQVLKQQQAGQVCYALAQREPC